MIIAEVRNLKKIYTAGTQKTAALNGVDLSVQEGEFVSVVGASGSGKTTLLHLLGALDEPSEGTVRIRGHEISKLEKEERIVFRRRNIGFVFQNYNLIPVLKWNELRALKYVGTGEGGKRQERRSGGKLTMRKMAWRNVTRSKKRLAVSLMSLLLGGIAALGAIVITTGSSIENQIREKPDFEAGILAGIFRYPEKVPEEIDDNTPVLSESFLEAVSGLDGIKKETFEATRGSYAVIDFSKDRVLQPRKESLDESETGIRFATLQIVSDEYVASLEQYVKEQEVNLNLTDLREGNGCILLHYHEMSELLNEKMRKAAGNPVHFYSLDAYGKEESQIDRYEKGSLVCDGYLDFTAKYFPKLQTTSMGNGINYFILTQKAFEQLGFSEKTYDVSFDAEETKRVSINQKLAQLVQQENERLHLFEHRLRSDCVHEEVEKRIANGRFAKY